jgi:replicative DNA helicase
LAQLAPQRSTSAGRIMGRSERKQEPPEAHVNPDHLALFSLEASVLGAILLDNGTLAQFPRLEIADFLHAKHRYVFSAVRELEHANRPIDVVTVQAELDRQGISSVDFADLGELVLHVPTVSNAIEYVRQIRNASLGRRVRLALSEILERADEHDGAELLSMAMAAMSCIDGDQPDATTGITALVRKRFSQLERIAQERASGRRTMTGFPTGVAALDEKLGGWQPGIVSIVAGRPGMGKSSLSLATADASSAAGFGAHLFSLEDTEESYADRTISRMSEVPSEKLRNTELSVGDCAQITRAQIKIRGRRWIVDGRSGITADEIVRSVRRHRKQNETRVALVDYVQLVKHADRRPRASTHEALTEIVTTLADAAKHDGIAYVVMSQLNREIEKRQDKRPQLSDLRESGSLEERAKCVVGVYRGSVYGDPVRGVDWDPGWEGRNYAPAANEHAAQVQLCVMKNSNGRTGTVFAHWSGPTTTVS